MTTVSDNEAGYTAIAARSTMRDVAALAGVGLKTVSRVINNEPNVSAKTIARVRVAAEQLEYRLDIHAGNLRRTDRKTRTLGLVMSLPPAARRYSPRASTMTRRASRTSSRRCCAAGSMD